MNLSQLRKGLGSVALSPTWWEAVQGAAVILYLVFKCDVNSSMSFLSSSFVLGVLALSC
eukprot:COSAG01_NODE_12753_length_1690_cov_24.654305_2_plen_59_part_00